MGASEADRPAAREASMAPGLRWQSAGPSHIHAHLTRPVVVHLDRFGAHSVLDLGCGNGWFTEALTRCGFDATGADVSASGIELARYSYPEVPFIRMDVTQPLAAELCGQFDAVVALELLDHVASPRLALRQAIAALRPGGLLIATVPFHGYVKNLGLALSARLDERWQALRDHGRVRFFSRRTLLALMAESGLQDLQFATIGRVPVIARSMLVVGRAATVTARGD